MARPMPKMTPLRMEKGDDLRRWQMLENWFLFVPGWGNIYIPKEFIFDAASIPKIFRVLYDPTGYLLFAAIVHDFEYQHGYYLTYNPSVDIENPEFRPDYVARWDVDREIADILFRQIADDVYPHHACKTAMAYNALKVGGSSTWDEYRENDPLKGH